MAVLTRDEILKLVKGGGVLSIEPFTEDVVRENGLTLGLGLSTPYTPLMGR